MLNKHDPPFYLITRPFIFTQNLLYFKHNSLCPSENMFERITKALKKPDKKEAEPLASTIETYKKPAELPEEVGGENDTQLTRVIKNICESPQIFDLVSQQIFDLNLDSFGSVNDVKKMIQEKAESEPLYLAKLVESNLGKGTFRILSFVDKNTNASKNVFKILRAKNQEDSFENKIQKGHYMGIMESYDVQWNFEKASRDILQNFFDANGQTLDGIKIEKREDGDKFIIEISGSQQYDWRELIHIGASSKSDSETSAGGFGEGAKILSLVLLRDYGVQELKFSSGDWNIEYYLDEIPEKSYHKKTQGLYVKKSNRQKQDGNSLKIVFPIDQKERGDDLEKAKELFYSSENEDF